MATLFEYKCKKCGYSVSANPKGHDMVMKVTSGIGTCHTIEQ